MSGGRESLTSPGRLVPRPQTGDARRPEVTPLDQPALKWLPQFLGEWRDRMLWGTYRSGLYFGALATAVTLTSACCSSYAAEHLLLYRCGLSTPRKGTCPTSVCLALQACGCGCQSRCSSGSCGLTRCGRRPGRTSGTTRKSGIVSPVSCSLA